MFLLKIFKVFIINMFCVVLAINMIRNVLCPFYGKCLDQAVKENAAGWDCQPCVLYKVDGDIEETDFVGEQLFLWALFKPHLYKLYNESKKSNEE